MFGLVVHLLVGTKANKVFKHQAVGGGGGRCLSSGSEFNVPPASLATQVEQGWGCLPDLREVTWEPNESVQWMGFLNAKALHSY